LEPPSKDESEANKFIAKQLRYNVHTESRLDRSDSDRMVEVVQSGRLFDGFWLGDTTLLNGYIHRGYGGVYFLPAGSEAAPHPGGSRRQKALSSPAAFRLTSNHPQSHISQQRWRLFPRLFNTLLD